MPNYPKLKTPENDTPDVISEAGLKPLRILYFIGALATGGSEMHLARLMLRLDRTRVEPSLLVLDERGKLLQSVRDAGIDVHVLRPSRGRFTGTLSAVGQVRAVLRDVQPDVLHAYGYNCQLLAALGSLFSRPKLVLGARRGNEVGSRRHLIYRLTNPLVDTVLCVSKATAKFSKQTEGLSEKKSHVITNGIDLTNFPVRPARKGPICKIGTVGRLREVKGTDLLVEAFEILRNEGGFGADIELHLAGPADRQWGRDFRATVEGRDGVFFHGDVDARDFLPSLDMFVLPSRSEGMSNALLEAMSVGLPIVATRVGGNAEVLDNGTCGVLVEPSAPSLAEGIGKLLENTESADELAILGRDRVEAEFEIGGMVERYTTFYEGRVR